MILDVPGLMRDLSSVQLSPLMVPALLTGLALFQAFIEADTSWFEQADDSGGAIPGLYAAGATAWNIAQDARGYIRESIVSPSAHIVPGAMYSADGTSFMPTGYDGSLTDEQIDQLTAYLETLK